LGLGPLVKSQSRPLLHHLIRKAQVFGSDLAYESFQKGLLGKVKICLSFDRRDAARDVVWSGDVSLIFLRLIRKQFSCEWTTAFCWRGETLIQTRFRPLRFYCDRPFRSDDVRCQSLDRIRESEMRADEQTRTGCWAFAERCSTNWRVFLF